jgi:hypothetical protein
MTAEWFRRVAASRPLQLRCAAGFLLLTCVVCFAVAWERSEAQAQSVQRAGQVFQGLPGVQEDNPTPISSMVAVVLGVLTGAAGLGCLLFGFRPDGRVSKR